MPQRPCLTCGAVTRNGSYCPDHEPTGRQSHGRRGSTRTWRGLRAQTLQRDGYQCVTCGTTHGLEIHHLIALHAGGPDRLDNLSTRCHACHTAAHHAPASS